MTPPEWMEGALMATGPESSTAGPLKGDLIATPVGTILLPPVEKPMPVSITGMVRRRGNQAFALVAEKIRRGIIPARAVDRRKTGR